MRAAALRRISSLAPLRAKSPAALPPRRHACRAMSDEQAKAQAAANDDGEPTIFDKIIAKEIPAEVIYEDETCMAFRDINAQAPTHFLVIPKVRDGLTRLSNATEKHKAVLGHCMWAAAHVAKEQGLAKGYRTVINDGPEGCQSVYHLHIHVLGGKQLSWPPGC
uniref:HIT domain-containing protein n=1 Tax=Prasinoderma singulare TaxID=676789 RepID=A0A7S3FK91_9VIRI|mmetsp:Transcript_5849/g.17611  ORF Transcript_5849/g.17611 Transcript_5849/m.17611 type:complete len:164 (+) Transcript_5849:6-497(+)